MSSRSFAIRSFSQKVDKKFCHCSETCAYCVRFHEDRLGRQPEWSSPNALTDSRWA